MSQKTLIEIYDALGNGFVKDADSRISEARESLRVLIVAERNARRNDDFFASQQ